MFRKPMLFALVLCAIITALSFVSRTPIHAATPFQVTTNIDALDANPGDGVCASASNGCTLRAAVAEVNAGKGDEISLQTNQTYTLSGGELYLTSDVTIRGKGFNSVLDGQNATRLLRVANGVTTVLHDLTLLHGKADKGGAIRNDGGTVWLEHVHFYENTATKYGGGVYSQGTLILNKVSMSYNTAAEAGGAIYSNSYTEIASSTLSRNTATGYHGGGIYNETNGLVRLTNSTVSNNGAGSHGGGFYNGINATTELYNVTVANNQADKTNSNQGDGGGVYNFGGTFKLVNTVVANNLVENGATDTNNDCEGAFSMLYSMVRTNTCALSNLGGSFTGINPGLLDLTFAGGPTETHDLLPTSQLIDRGDPAGCKSNSNFAIVNDQRGNARAIDGNYDSSAICDIGSVEYTTAAQCFGTPNKPALTKPADSGTVTKRKVKLDWDDVSCATEYKVVVKQDSKNGPTVAKGTTNLSKFKTVPLARGHTYYWKVKACNLTGCVGTKKFSFTIQ